MPIIIDNSVKNKKDTPSITSDVAANLPAATDVPVGAIYIETDTGTIKQSDGITWNILGGGGGPGTQDLASVLSIGNTATNNIVLNGTFGNGNLTANTSVTAGQGQVILAKSTSGYVEIKDNTERKAIFGDGPTDIAQFCLFNKNRFVFRYFGTMEGEITTLISAEPLVDVSTNSATEYIMYQSRPQIDSKKPGPNFDTVIGYDYDPFITNAANINFVSFRSKIGSWQQFGNNRYIEIGYQGNPSILVQDTFGQNVGQYNNSDLVLSNITGTSTTLQPANLSFTANSGDNQITVNNNSSDITILDRSIQQSSIAYTTTGITQQSLLLLKTFNLFFYEGNGGGYINGDYYFQGQASSGLVKTIDYQEKNVIDWDFGINPTLTVDGLYTKTYFCSNAGGNIVLDNTQFTNGVIVYICIDHSSTGNVAVTTAGPVFPPALLGASPINKSGMYSVTYNANLDTFAISHV